MENAAEEKLKNILKSYKFKPFRQYSEISDTELLRYCLSIFKDLKSGSKVFFAKEEASGLFEFLPWDSNLFGMRMARAAIFLSSAGYSEEKQSVSDLLDRIISHCEREEIAHISIKVDPKEMPCIHAMEERGFYLSGTTVVYTLDLRKINPRDFKMNFKIRPFGGDDLKYILPIAKVSFSDPDMWFDRFHADPNLPKQKSDELYIRWIENCCKGTEADVVLVADNKGVPVGFIDAKLDKDANKIFKIKFASIPLNAVDPSYRKQGIYRCMVLGLLDWLKDKVDIVTITTQLTSIAVQRTWQKLGASPESFKHIFHKFITY